MRLVQPATVPQSRSWQQDNALKPLLKALDIKPTGIPELSDGAVPEALFRFINCRRLKKFGNIRLRLSLLGEEEADRFVTMHYLVRERQEDQLRAELSNWNEQPLVMRVRPAKTNKTFCFCIDEDAECFFWVANQGRTLLEKTLPVSAKMFRSAMKPLRPTATTLEGILNEVEQVVEDRYTRMEKDDD
jgi:hypothetical protein